MPDEGTIKRIGTYDILREVGRGGMATVYEARGPQGVHVALKVIDASRARTDRSLRRFLREGEAAKKLDHPNVIKISDVGQDGDYCFIAMDLIDGPTLEDLVFELRRNRKKALAHFRLDLSTLPEPIIGQKSYQRTVLLALAAIADAVQAAHDGGLVHRDIKPSNILIASDSRLVLTDFGLVQELGADTLTVTGDVLGTPLYMSPEQIAGERASIGPKSDIYALGATMHECLGLNPPYAATDIAVLAQQIARQEPRNLAELNPRLDRDVLTIVRRAMAKRAKDRYAQAGDIARDIRLYLDGRPILAKPHSAKEKLRSRIRKNPAWAWGGAAAISLFLVSGAILLFVAQKDAGRRLREGRRSFADGEAFLASGSWVAAWRAAREIERDAEDEQLAFALRTSIEARLTREFEARCQEKYAGLRRAFELNMVAQKLDGAGLNFEDWRQSMMTCFFESATEQSGGQDEALLNSVWQSLSRETSEDDRVRWGRFLRDQCHEAQEKFSYQRAYLIASRGRRWGFQIEGPGKKTFPPLGFARWDTAPFDRLEELARDLEAKPLEFALDGLDREEFLSLPWPEAHDLLRARFQSADLAEARGLLGICQLANVPDTSSFLLPAGKRLEGFRLDLLSHFANSPEPAAQDALLSWFQDDKDEGVRGRLVRACASPGLKARTFLEGQLQSADPVRLKLLAEVLLSYEPKRETLAQLKSQVSLLDPEERDSRLLPMIQLGVDVPWPWIRSWIDTPGKSRTALMNALMERPSLIPDEWVEQTVLDGRGFRQQLARNTALAQPRLAKKWAQTILLDRGEDLATRVRAGTRLSQEEAHNLFSSPTLFLSSDPVLAAFSLNYKPAKIKRISPEHIKRVAALFEIYREENDDLMRAWALESLGGMEVPEFALVIAQDLSTFDVDAEPSLLREILGRTQRSLLLEQVLALFSANGLAYDLSRSANINVGRCRLLGAMGDEPGWQDSQARRDVARSLIECAARRDLPVPVRRQALRSLASYGGDFDHRELQKAAVFDSRGELAGAAALTLDRLGKPEAGLRFLESQRRPTRTTEAAAAWISAKLGRSSDCIHYLQKAYMRGYRADRRALDFESLKEVSHLPAFRQIWSRLQGK